MSALQVLALALFIVSLCFLVTVVKMFHLIKMLTEVKGAEAKAQHAVCIAHIASFVGDAFAARVLTAAADDMDTLDGEVRMRELRSEWVEGGPSVPAMFLLQRAEDLDPTPPILDEYTFNGERV